MGRGEHHLNVDNLVVSNPQLDIDLADNSRLFLGKAFDNNTLAIGNLTGGSGTQIISSFNATAGNPPVVRILSVNQTIDGTYTGLLADSNNNRDLGLIKNGNASLVLTNPLTEYSGPTTINAGTLHITDAGCLNYRPIPNQAAIQGTYPGAITSDGIFHIDSSATQEFTGPITGLGTLRKSNTGFLTLTGDGSGFSGDTLIEGGRLAFNHTLNGDVELGGGASLGGTGNSTGTLTTSPDATLILTGGPTTAALAFESAVIGGPTYIEFATPQQNAVVYDVLSYGTTGGLTGYENLVPLARGTLSHDTANQKVTFTAIAPGARIWDIADGVWNSQGILENWAGGDKIFIQGDQAVFDAIASDTTITLDGLLAPSTVNVVHPANTYSFIGSGGLTGNGAFNKTAAGILRVATANPNFAGPTFINSGIFRLLDGSHWGTSPITNNAGLEVDVASDLTLANNIAGTGTLTKRGPGTLRIDGISENTFTGDVVVEAGKLVLVKPGALGVGNAGAKSVTIHAGAQIDLNDFAISRRTERRLDLACTYRIAGHGDGTGAIVNNHGGGGISYYAGILNLELTADASVGGTTLYDTGHYLMGKNGPSQPGTITGNGHTLTKVGPNMIRIGGVATDITIVVAEGTLSGLNRSACLGGASGFVTLHSGATLGMRGISFEPDGSPIVIQTPILLHGGSKLEDMNGGITTWAGPITLNSGIVTIHNPHRDKVITGTVGGSGGFVKTGIWGLTLTAQNTYTGPTTVSEGTLVIQQPYLADAAAVTVASGATLNLAFTGTDVVSALTLGGAVMGPGTYNATTHPLLLAGTGALVVVDPDDYDNWSGPSGFNLNGGRDDDDDLDGLTNFQEYAFGLNPTDPSSVRPHTPPDRNGGIFTYTRRKPLLTQLSYSYESSTTLDGWSPITPPAPDLTDDGNPVETITVTLPAALLAEPSAFLRVKAVR